MIISVTKDFRFEAAHSLPNHKGKCKYLHGHSYLLRVTVAGRVFDLEEEKDKRERHASDMDFVTPIRSKSEDGMVMDFGDLKEIVQREVIEKLDHKNLNEVFGFRPTAENMVRELVKIIGPKVDLYYKWNNYACDGKTGPALVGCRKDRWLQRVRLYETVDSYAEWVNEDEDK